MLFKLVAEGHFSAIAASFNPTFNQDSEEWRWLQIDDNIAITEEKKHEFIARADSIDLFSSDAFL